MAESTDLKKPILSTQEKLVFAIILIGYALVNASKLDYLSGLIPDQFKRLILSLEGWNVGSDAIAPEYEVYWMNFLYIEFVLEVSTAGILSGYLWKTYDRRMAEISTREELRRTIVHSIWLFAYGLVINYDLVNSTEIKIHNTDFTPNHILETYLFYPIYITTGFCTFLYAKTRLPFFMQKSSIPYLMSLLLSPFILLNHIKYGGFIWFISTFVENWGFINVIISSYVSIFRKIRQEGISSL